MENENVEPIIVVLNTPELSINSNGQEYIFEIKQTIANATGEMITRFEIPILEYVYCLLPTVRNTIGLDKFPPEIVAKYGVLTEKQGAKLFLRKDIITE